MNKKSGGSDTDSDFSLHRGYELICNSIGQKKVCMKTNVGTGFLGDEVKFCLGQIKN